MVKWKVTFILKQTDKIIELQNKWIWPGLEYILFFKLAHLLTFLKSILYLTNQSTLSFGNKVTYA